MKPAIPEDVTNSSNVAHIKVYRCDKLFARQVGWGLQKLLSVKEMKIGGKYEDVVSFPEPGLMPSSLTTLFIGDFPNMKSWDNKGLQRLSSTFVATVENCTHHEQQTSHQKRDGDTVLQDLDMPTSSLIDLARVVD